MRCSISSPSSCNWKKDTRLLSDECGLLLGSEQQVSISLLDGGERGENVSAYAEIDRAHVRAFFGTFEAQGDSFEVFRGHPSSLSGFKNNPGFLVAIPHAFYIAQWSRPDRVLEWIFCRFLKQLADRLENLLH